MEKACKKIAEQIEQQITAAAREGEDEAASKGDILRKAVFGFGSLFGIYRRSLGVVNELRSDQSLPRMRHVPGELRHRFKIVAQYAQNWVRNWDAIEAALKKMGIVFSGAQKIFRDGKGPVCLAMLESRSTFGQLSRNCTHVWKSLEMLQ